ncbi:N-6 DNA methylase [Paenibacillus agricola]|uniref:site-specific DNA-methyltransferase (adenine-specific) n=1 Tax=Paenibacillus agricola TaxID=2716264 RepID=A0ABX0JEP6_9BACL|nr:N-6 DNA methylase [Paenibacillus agricola]NHN34373.1 N-6 DNA methylase [Paenibacillus agricola]
MVTNKSEAALFGMADKLRSTVLTAEKYDNVIVPLFSLRYGYVFQEKYDLHFTMPWSEISGDRSGNKVMQALGELASQRSEIQHGLMLLDIESCRGILPELMYQLEKIEFIEDSSELLETYFQAGAKLRSKYGTLFEPNEINDLAVRILDVKPNASVYDFAAGYARSLVQAAQSNVNVSIHGNDINKEAVGIGQLYCFVSGLQQFNYEQNDVFTLLSDEVTSERKYNYVISHPPLGLKLDQEIRTKYGVIRRDATMGFVIHALDSLKEDGKAIVTVSNSVLFQGAATGDIRKDLVDDDLIDAVITLPAGIFMGTSIPITMLVLDKNKTPERKGKVQIIDATSFGERKRGETSMSSAEIDQIMDRYLHFKEDNKLSRILDVFEIRQNNYNLLPSSYVQMEDANSIIGEVQIDRSAFENNIKTVPLRQVVDIYRGLNTAGSLDTETTKAKVIQLADLQDGVLHLDSVQTYGLKATTNEKECEIKAGDVLLTSRGIVMKFAVVSELEEDDSYYLSANFIGLRPLPGVNPYFLLAFFESPIGESYIRSLRKGAALPILNVKDIQDIPIPKLSSDEMEQIGNRYKKTSSDYAEAIKAAKRIYINQLEQVYENIGVSKGYKKKSN